MDTVRSSVGWSDAGGNPYSRSAVVRTAGCGITLRIMTAGGGSVVSADPLRTAALGIIVPTLDEERWLPGCLDCLHETDAPVVVVDGGSTDGTCAVATNHPVQPRLLRVPGGRHRQLNSAVTLLRTTWVLILPADGRLLPGAIKRIVQACHRLTTAAACLTMRADDAAWHHRLRGVWSGVRCRSTGGAYLDQAPLFRRRDVLAVGGFRAHGSYDSADLGQRLRHHGALTVLPEPVVVSCREYRRLGFWPATCGHQRRRWRRFHGDAGPDYGHAC